jgi:glycosyltransferase involved in cell wall biosynthesis
MSGAGLVTVTCETVGERMAGPAIRALELSRAVQAAGHRVELLSLGSAGTDPAGSVPVRAVGPDGVLDAARSAGAVLIQGDVLGRVPQLAELDVPIVVDAYDPFHLEQLEQARSLGEHRRRIVVRDCVSSLNTQLGRADLVLAASGRQRDLWLGHMAAIGRVNPLTYDADHRLGDLLRVVPFGLPDSAPPPAADPVRAAFPEIGADATVLLWAGGLYDWFDPGLVIDAAARLRAAGHDVHLVLLGAAHPVLGTPTRTENAVRERASGLSWVHLPAHWVPYLERTDWLQAADLCVVAHHPGVETEFAFRTRLLDHLWTARPTVTTWGDALGDELGVRGAAVGAAPGDVDGYAEALVSLLDAERRRACAEATAAVAATLRWSVVAAPLVAFVAAPLRAPDLTLSDQDRGLLRPAGPVPAGAAARLRAAWAEGGPRLLAARAGRRVGGLLRRG